MGTIRDSYLISWNLPVWTEFNCLNLNLPVRTGIYRFEPGSTCFNRNMPVQTGIYLFEPESTGLNPNLSFLKELTCLNRNLPVKPKFTCLNWNIPVWTGLTNLTGLITNPPSIATRHNPDIHKNVALRP